MADRSFLNGRSSMRSTVTWPIALDAWARKELADIDHSNVDETCKALVKALGDAGWLKLSAVDPADETSKHRRAQPVYPARDAGRHDGLADFAFAMQGLGHRRISLFGRPDQKAEWLTKTRAGKALSAFALSEPARDRMSPTWR
jgi:acyl-CoA dehydrogenase